MADSGKDFPAGLSEDETRCPRCGSKVAKGATRCRYGHALVESADEPRDSHGRWVKGVGQGRVDLVVGGKHVGHVLKSGAMGSSYAVHHDEHGTIGSSATARDGSPHFQKKLFGSQAAAKKALLDLHHGRLGEALVEAFNAAEHPRDALGKFIESMSHSELASAVAANRRNVKTNYAEAAWARRASPKANAEWKRQQAAHAAAKTLLGDEVKRRHAEMGVKTKGEDVHVGGEPAGSIKHKVEHFNLTSSMTTNTYSAHDASGKKIGDHEQKTDALLALVAHHIEGKKKAKESIMAPLDRRVRRVEEAIAAIKPPHIGGLGKFKTELHPHDRAGKFSRTFHAPKVGHHVMDVSSGLPKRAKVTNVHSTGAVDVEDEKGATHRLEPHQFHQVTRAAKSAVPKPAAVSKGDAEHGKHWPPTPDVHPDLAGMRYSGPKEGAGYYTVRMDGQTFGGHIQTLSHGPKGSFSDKEANREPYYIELGNFSFNGRTINDVVKKATEHQHAEWQRAQARGKTVPAALRAPRPLRAAHNAPKGSPERELIMLKGDRDQAKRMLDHDRAAELDKKIAAFKAKHNIKESEMDPMDRRVERLVEAVTPYHLGHGMSGLSGWKADLHPRSRTGEFAHSFAADASKAVKKMEKANKKPYHMGHGMGNLEADPATKGGEVHVDSTVSARAMERRVGAAMSSEPPVGDEATAFLKRSQARGNADHPYHMGHGMSGGTGTPSAPKAAPKKAGGWGSENYNGSPGSFDSLRSVDGDELGSVHHHKNALGGYDGYQGVINYGDGTGEHLSIRQIRAEAMRDVENHPDVKSRNGSAEAEAVMARISVYSPDTSVNEMPYDGWKIKDPSGEYDGDVNSNEGGSGNGRYGAIIRNSKRGWVQADGATPIEAARNAAKKMVMEGPGERKRTGSWG